MKTGRHLGSGSVLSLPNSLLSPFKRSRNRQIRSLGPCCVARPFNPRAATTGNASPSSAAPAPQRKFPLTNTLPPERDYGSLDKSQYGLFVQFFRHASPYIEGHRGRTFVLAIPGDVVDRKDLLHTLLEDVALLHGLGVRLVVVVGARSRINEAIRAFGIEPEYAGGYRVTDEVAMEAAVAAAGAARMEVEARLSKGPEVTMIRRHSRGATASTGQSGQYGPALTTVSGNYVAAKRKGVVNGVDYKNTGVVRFVQRDAVKKQLDSGNIVLLSNLGYSAAGEVLNCDTYTVAVRAAVDLGADKLILMTLPEAQPLDLPAWLPLQDAEGLLATMVEGAAAADGGSGTTTASGIKKLTPNELLNSTVGGGSISGDEMNFSSNTSGNNGDSGDSGSDGYRSETNNGNNNYNTNGNSSNGNKQLHADLDFDHWYEQGLPLPLLAACMSCRAGVNRSHLVDARVDGALLLELYSRDGVGVMISNDFYEGLRPAQSSDLAGIENLLSPLVEKGVLVRRTPEQLLEEVPYFTVLERESKLLACATVKPLGKGPAGESVAELAAFCVHPDYRGGGKGDSLLEYLESDARAKGIQRLVLLTTRTADWFEQRGFVWAGQAHASDLLPEERRKKVDPSRNSQLYTKTTI
jgi:amino-acid N-acetyltransferase